MSAPATPQASTTPVSNYRPFPGVMDEMIGPDGEMRPHWAGLMAHLTGREPEALAADVARGEQYLRDAGVFFRAYGRNEQAARDWPFSPVPVILHEDDWQEIAKGLTERADLLEMVMADLYGPGRLVAEGHLPASLIAESPEWMRPMVGVAPRGGHFLHFLAFEIGRGPDGRWWVLGDRTQAPSGAGFALENRVATTRVFADYYARARVHRLAGFFRAFRDGLAALQGPAAHAAGSAAGILTPGPMTDTYYEHAYIARYMGLSLLEGGDLTVEDEALMVRTVAGPRPINVLWRRLDAGWADPLEFDESSHIGTPGLMAAVRAGQVTLVNALGAGVLETQALLAFLPGIARATLGRDLRLPNIATWWCGQSRALAEVRRQAARLAFGPAQATQVAFLGGAEGMQAPSDAAARDAWIVAQGPKLIAQERVTLSTTPTLSGGALVPRPVTIRVFLARTPNGWQVMPGGFARIAERADATALAMQQGSSAADVWVLSEAAVPTETLLAPQSAPFVRAEAPALPSRAAENLFWLGRYVERTQGVLRLARAYHGRLSEDGTGPLLAALAEMLDRYGLTAAEPMPEGLFATLASAVAAASQIRDRFSVDGWAALSDLDRTMKRLSATLRPGDDAAAAMGVFLRKIAGFSGLVHENMYRGHGWQFLSIGRALERGAMSADLLAAFADPDAPTGALDLAIELADSVMTHRQRYAVMPSRGSVVDLLALDPENPRSVHFQLAEIREHATAIAGGRHKAQMSGLVRQARTTETRLAVATPSAMTTAALRDVRDDILALSELLGDAYLQ
ncbi:MAG: hypothetical protein GC146_04210 [Limimaricola sp.]|uniref:circularly permuted type 2 ATP-grasp protein n=1 Tax=Limimaricola sp. TaxID=2211665 RepID=UPI001D546A9C|nr:circularly permuted type 2 ATP-grasp protein [Limimaricola sp.]MBI1416406.1 hypothetical protein [Limimaricola sp.]